MSLTSPLVAKNSVTFPIIADMIPPKKRMSKGTLEDLPKSLRLLSELNQVFSPSGDWVLEMSRKHWGRLNEQRRGPREALCKGIAGYVFKHTAGDTAQVKTLRQRVFDIAQKFGFGAQLSDFSEQSLSGFLWNLTKNETPLDNQKDHAHHQLYETFWQPLRAKAIAIVGVWAPNAHYDLIPLMKLNHQLTSNISKQIEFIYFDDQQRPILPKAPTYDSFSALCLVGRPSLYKTCPLLWDGYGSVLPSTQFEMPDVNEETFQHLKKPVTSKFHYVHSRLNTGQETYETKDIKPPGSNRMHRTDYALIQRLFLPEYDVHIVLLHGCSALGTHVATEEATERRFAAVPWNKPIDDEQNVEILLRARASIDWTIDDEIRHKRGELITRPWENILVTPLFVCIDNNPVSLTKVPTASAPSAAHYVSSDQSGAARLRARFQQFQDEMEQRYRYANNKFRIILRDKWPFLRQIVAGNPVEVPLSYLEIHPGEPCQLACQFCRGGLRSIPPGNSRLSREELCGTVMELHKLNPNAFVRFSGTIGEPLRNSDIVHVFRLLKEKLPTLRWGLTTNGLQLIDDGISDLLMRAQYVHISLDAGTDETYQKLKHGKTGNFDIVLSGIKKLALKKKGMGSERPEIVVSFLLQDENYREILQTSKVLKSIGVNTFEIKMQHFDERRQMSELTVHEAYRLVQTAKSDDEDSPDYQVLAVQSEAMALTKIRAGSPAVDFPRCYANLLGLNSTIDARGNIQTCCQYFQTSNDQTHSEHTLGVQGKLKGGLASAWKSPERAEVLKRDPRKICSQCSPSDEFVNRFVSFLCDASREDPSFLDWVERNYVHSYSNQSAV